MSCGFSFDVEVDASGVFRRGGEFHGGLRSARPQDREGKDDADGYRRRADDESEVVAADQGGRQTLVG